MLRVLSARSVKPRCLQKYLNCQQQKWRREEKRATHPCDRELRGRELESIKNGFGIHEDILPWTKLLLAPVLINIDVLLMRVFSIVHVCLSVCLSQGEGSFIAAF